MTRTVSKDIHWDSKGGHQMKFFPHWIQQQEEGGARRDEYNRQEQKFWAEFQGEGRH